MPHLWHQSGTLTSSPWVVHTPSCGAAVLTDSGEDLELAVMSDNKYKSGDREKRENIASL